MSLSQEAMMDLMAYADGELEGDADARARVRAMIETTPEAAQFVHELATLGEVVRVVQGSRRTPKTVDFIADDVMKQIARQPRLVVNNDPPGVRMKRAIAAGSVSVVLAMAAAWLLFVQTRPSGVGTPANANGPLAANTTTAAAPSVTTLTPPPAATTPSPADSAVAGVDLDNVESPHHEVSVFFVPSIADAKASSVVVWIGGETGKGKAP